MNVETGAEEGDLVARDHTLPTEAPASASTRRPCLECGIDACWTHFDLVWLHMGWTVSGDKAKNPKPHRARVE